MRDQIMPRKMSAAGRLPTNQVIAGLINAMRELMKPAEPKQKQPIGFVTEKQK